MASGEGAGPQNPIPLDKPPAPGPAMQVAAPARTDGGPDVPSAMDLPQVIRFEDALRIFRARGFDILIAEAAVQSSEGDLKTAGAVPNPALSFNYGRVFNYNADRCPVAIDCSNNVYTVALSDQAAIEDSLSGKRGLRLKVARNALAAARQNRVDAQRNLEFQVKSAYFQVVQARAAYDFTKEVQDASTKTFDLNQARLNGGKINEGDLARVETAKLEADQAVDTALQNLRQAKVGLAFLLGVRGHVPEYEIEREVLDYNVPPRLDGVTDETLLREAFNRRPDLVALGYQRQRAEAAIALAKRQRFPDITFSLTYTQNGTGQNAITPPTAGFGISAPIPLFYQQQGEIRRAQADFSTQSLQRAKLEAQVVSDVESAFSAYAGSRVLVERMKVRLLDSARKARDITKIQFEAGKANLTDYLDAQRTFIATNVEYFQDLTNYWTAVAQLEQAVGMELKP